LAHRLVRKEHERAVGIGEERLDALRGTEGGKALFHLRIRKHALRMLHVVEKPRRVEYLEARLEADQEADRRYRHLDGAERHALYRARNLPELVRRVDLDLD